MTAQEQILKGILDDANKTADDILKNAKEQADVILEAAKKEAKTASGETVSAALKKAVTIKENAESSATLILRDARLKRKIREIEEVLEKATEEICKLSDEEYFDIILKMAKNKADNKNGELFLSATDLAKRNTEYLKDGIKKSGLMLTLSTAPADIKSGFLIKYGDIEINSSFSAIVQEKKELLEDTVNAALFTE